MKKFYLALFAMAVALAITPAAKATTFYFDYYAAGVSSSGTLVGTEIGNTGSYQITSGSITTTSGYGTYSGTIDASSGSIPSSEAYDGWHRQCPLFQPHDPIRQIPRRAG